MNKVIIIGCGGHARSCLDIIIDTKDYDISGFIGELLLRQRKNQKNYIISEITSSEGN